MGPSGPSTDRATLQRQVKNHLLLNFTDMSEFADSDVRVFVRGDGCHVIDADGRRAIDGISGLFCTNLGHGFGAEIGTAAQKQMSELVFTPSWYVTHPAAAALAERLADLASPLGLTRVFLTSGGGEANEAAGSWPASGTPRTASRSAARPSRAASPTTAPRSAHCRSPASRTPGTRSSRCRSRRFS